MLHHVYVLLESKIVSSPQPPPSPPPPPPGLAEVLIVLGLNDNSTLVGHFLSSPKEREKRDKR